MNEQESVGGMERTCSQCGAQVAPGVKFCGSCGTPLEEMEGTHGEAKKPTCPKCGAEIYSGKKFCVKCGAQVVQFCPSCGAQQILGEPFCGTCGASMSGAAGAGSAGLKPVGFKEAWKRGWKFSAQGRASRGEYWWRMLSLLLEGFLLAIVLLLIVGIPCEWDFDDASVASLIVAYVLYALWFLPMSIALLFLRIRRLHDQGLSGWWVLLWNTPPAPPIIGLFFSLRSGTRGPNQFGPVPGIRQAELQAEVERQQKLKLRLADVWNKESGVDGTGLRFTPQIRKIFIILAGCLAVLGLFGWNRHPAAPPWGADIFRTFVPFVGLLFLALPSTKPRKINAGVVLESVSVIVVFIATLIEVCRSTSWYFRYSAWNLVWPVCLGVFLYLHLSRRQQAKRVCAWVFAGWCLLWVFNSGIASFWERLLMFGQCALWGLIALKEGRPGLVSDSQEPGAGQVG